MMSHQTNLGAKASQEIGHLLIVAPTPFFSDRGCHVRILEEARAAEACGYRCTICTYHLGKNISGLTIQRSLRVPWYNKISAGPSLHKFYIDLFLLWSCLRIAWRDRPVLIHAHLHEGIVIGKIISFLLRVPLIGDLQGSLCGELVQHRFLRSRSLVYRLFSMAERWIIRWPDHLILSSERAIEGESESQWFPARMTVVKDSVDTVAFAPTQPDEQLREKLGLSKIIPSSRKIVGFLGLLNEYQGVGVMLKTAHHVLDRFREVHFLIMGYPDVEKYQSMAGELGISQHVSFLGRIPYGQARDYLAACDIGFSAKQELTEANGKLLNYMAVGLPTVATDTKVNRAMLGSEAALYGHVDDPQSLSHALLTLLHDPELTESIGVKARHRVINHFSWLAVTAKLESTYQSVLREKIHGEIAATMSCSEMQLRSSALAHSKRNKQDTKQAL